MATRGMNSGRYIHDQSIDIFKLNSQYHLGNKLFQGHKCANSHVFNTIPGWLPWKQIVWTPYDTYTTNLLSPPSLLCNVFSKGKLLCGYFITAVFCMHTLMVFKSCLITMATGYKYLKICLGPVHGYFPIWDKPMVQWEAPIRATAVFWIHILGFSPLWKPNITSSTD